MNAGERLFEDLVESATLEAERRIMERIGPVLSQTQDRTMEVPEAAPYIGVSNQLLYKMCAEKQIPHWRAGVTGTRKPKLLFSSLALDNWKQEQMRGNYLRAQP